MLILSLCQGLVEESLSSLQRLATSGGLVSRGGGAVETYLAGGLPRWGGASEAPKHPLMMGGGQSIRNRRILVGIWIGTFFIVEKRFFYLINFIFNYLDCPSLSFYSFGHLSPRKKFSILYTVLLWLEKN